MHTISFTLEDHEYQEAEVTARAKGLGGRNPVSAFGRYCLIQMMKKYPIKAAEREKYGKSNGTP